MKHYSISGIISFVTGAMFAILLICIFSSCTTVSRMQDARPEGDTRGSFWYGKRAEGVKFNQGHSI